MTSDDDIKATQEEVLQQGNFKKMLKYDPVEKAFISRLTGNIMISSDAIVASFGDKM